MVTVAPASATSTVPVMVWLAWLVGPPALVIATIGAVVSSVKLSEARAGVAEGIGLARHDGVRSVGQPARRERPGPLRDRPSPWWRWRLPSMVKCTTVLARPVPLSASIGGDVVGRRRAGIERQRLGHRRTGGAQRIDHRAAGGGVAGGIGDLGGQRVGAVLLSVTALLQLPLLCTMAVPIAVAPSRMVTVAPASADVDRAGDGLARLVGRTAGAGDRNRRRRRVQREAQRGACRCCRRLSVWLATMVCGSVGQPLGVNDHAPCGIGRHRGGDRRAVDGEVHHGAGQAGAAQRIVRR